jgi:outer membrane protein OmpA-like peptidoglycan-associated protein
MLKRLLLTACLPAFLLTVPLGASAQTLSAEDILKRLAAQRSRALAFVEESTPSTETASGSDIVITSPSAPATTTDPAATTAAVDLAAVTTPTEDLTPEMQAALTIELTILFGFDSAVLRAKSKPQLDVLCTAIEADKGDGRYQVIGHTDAAGSEAYNQVLSLARAEEVVRYMVDTCKIDASRFEAIGFGESRLKNTKNPKADENRRVEIQVLS